MMEKIALISTNQFLNRFLDLLCKKANLNLYIVDDESIVLEHHVPILNDLYPDVVVFDLTDAEKSESKLTEFVKQLREGIKIVLLSSQMRFEEFRSDERVLGNIEPPLDPFTMLSQIKEIMEKKT